MCDEYIKKTDVILALIHNQEWFTHADQLLAIGVVDSVPTYTQEANNSANKTAV